MFGGCDASRCLCFDGLVHCSICLSSFWCFVSIGFSSCIFCFGGLCELYLVGLDMSVVWSICSDPDLSLSENK